MEPIVTQRPIVNWRKKTVKNSDLMHKKEIHLTNKPLSDGALQQFFAL
jgi:hypothetical protein